MLVEEGGITLSVYEDRLGCGILELTKGFSIV
jgi:hypothetical protein